ncbi:Transcription factor bHLH84 [Heracleum sosnowskyi]|uniref:Transcription factor bHLH84 n=1 Tax=Heracleum sosnowskyi TaxID=360622 RepID=A0AAD8JET7_9APIA|nr:Transcription factor bHLH84 [Heracleum sosnowskyi]
MESFDSILEGDWSSLYALHSTEESEFMEQLLGYCSIPSDLHFDSNFRILSDNTNIDPNDSTSFYPTSNYHSYYACDFDHILATNDNSTFCNEEANDENPSSVQVLSSADVHENILMQLDVENHMTNPVLHKDVVSSNPAQKSKKRSTNSGDVQKNKRSVKAKKNQNIEMMSCMKNNEKNAAVEKRGLSSCSSENDSIASDELNGVALNSSDSKELATFNSNGEMQAVRGSATDPQSLYARKRRERINEKLRTLQNLVPNGTKVDISTMLEDAVQYVKFLQLQIKLLSSDKWMYAPISYNGTDLGLDSNLSLPLC